MSQPADIFVDAAARTRITAWDARFAARIPRPFQAREVRTSQGPTRVLVGGPEGAPPVVVLHGVMASATHALLEAWPLLDHHRVYAIDVIGQSPFAPPLRPPLTGPSYGPWIVEVLDGLGLARPHVLGASWGGFVAWKTAAVAPTRVDHLVLVVPAGLARGPIFKSIVRLALPLRRYLREPTEANLRRFADAQTTMWDDDWGPYLGDAVRSFRMDLRPPPLAKPTELAGFTGPTMVLAAADDIHFPGPATLARARRVFAGLAVAELLPGCKHMPPTTDAFRTEVSDRVRAFLAR